MYIYIKKCKEILRQEMYKIELMFQVLQSYKAHQKKEKLAPLTIFNISFKKKK